MNFGIFFVYCKQIKILLNEHIMNYYLIGIIILLLTSIIVMVVKWPKVIELEDQAPKEDSPKNRWLQLQNEGGKYIKLEDGKVKVKIVK